VPQLGYAFCILPSPISYQTNNVPHIGWSIPLTIFATGFILFALSFPTSPTSFPDPFFRIWISRAYKANHGSDSLTFDNEGRFRPQMFEDIFTKYDTSQKGGLTWDDVTEFLKGQRQVWDIFGWVATWFEWTVTYQLIAPEDGILRKEDIRGVFDGSIFFKKAEQHRLKQMRVGQKDNTQKKKR